MLTFKQIITANSVEMLILLAFPCIFVVVGANGPADVHIHLHLGDMVQQVGQKSGGKYIFKIELWSSLLICFDFLCFQT